MTGRAQIFLYAYFSFRLSSRLIIDRRITKIGTNDRNHGKNTGLKSHHHEVHPIAFNLIYNMVYFDKYQYEKIDFEIVAFFLLLIV